MGNHGSARADQAVAGSGAASAAVVHPSGSPDPSRDDVEISRPLFEAGKILGGFRSTIMSLWQAPGIRAWRKRG